MNRWLGACGSLVLAAALSACGSSVSNTNGGAGGDDTSGGDTGVTTGAGGAGGASSTTSSTSSTSSTTSSTSSSTTGGGCTNAADCDDQDACTTDTCTAGACQHDAVATDDNNACTTDSCDKMTGVQHQPVAIDDNDACTTDACDPVSGVSHTPVPTDDGNVCTTDSCDPVNGVSHTPVSVDDANVCTTDSCDPVSGVMHAPIPVDDANVCTTDSCDPVNGVMHAAISCDDGDPCTVDTCDAVGGCAHGPLCAANETCNAGVCTPILGSPKVFATSSNGTPGFYEYDVKGNTWATRPNPPAVTYSQLTTDGSNVYLVGNDNKIYKYTPATQTWSYVQAGPGAESSQPIALFKYANNTFYYGNDGDTTLEWSANGGAWNTVNLPYTISCAGTYDANTGNIYARIYGNEGVMIFSTSSKTVTQTWTNATNVGENSRTGSYYNGYFYERGWSTPFDKMSMANGTVVSTNVTPSESHTSTDVNPATGDIYVGPYSTGTTFQVFNASTNTLKTLASLPVALTNHSTIVYVAGLKYWASGVQQNVPEAQLSGWNQCWSGTYADSASLTTILQSSCTKANLLMACRPVGNSSFTLLAMAPRADVLFDCGNTNNCTKQSNNVGWYYSGSYSWGFAPGGEPVNRNSCDYNAGNQTFPELRLCWHTGNSSITSGYRCGSNDLNGNASWQRVLYQAD